MYFDKRLRYYLLFLYSKAVQREKTFVKALQEYIADTRNNVLKNDSKPTVVYKVCDYTLAQKIAMRRYLSCLTLLRQKKKHWLFTY